MINLKNLLLNAGMKKEGFKAVFPETLRENTRNLMIFGPITACYFLLLAFVSKGVKGMSAVNDPYYILLVLVGVAVFLLAWRVLPKRPGLVLPTVYAFEASLYLFSYIITLLHPDKPAVTVVVLLVLMPFLFTDRTIRVCVAVLIPMAVYCVLAVRYKQPSAVESDVWNSVSFSCVSIAAAVYRMRGRFRMLYQEQEIRQFSIMDLLTGARNRNCFETDLSQYAKNCRKSLACVFADVNGLHEINNSQGHRAGDAMLQAVARQMILRFGETNTYRVGGDEFVVICADTDEETIAEKLRQINEELKKQDYYVSMGLAVSEKAELDISALTYVAENRMRWAKRAYYQQEGNDRRQR